MYSHLAAEEARAHLVSLIEKKVFVLQTPSDPWLFDFRSILLDGQALQAISVLFWESFSQRTTPFQLCGLEVTSLPLLAGITMHQQLVSIEREPPSACFMRKSRKKSGMYKIIEGPVIPNIPFILVDDILNSGNSIEKQVTVLEELGHTVSDVWCILRFRDESHYTFLKSKHIRIHSLFTLADFSDTLPVSMLKNPDTPPSTPLTYMKLWKFSAPHPSHGQILPKSRPCLDATRLFVGSDDGTFYALDQETGSVLWTKKIGLHPRGKGIFSSPHVHNGVVYFGAYDGNVYALDADTGKTLWVNFDADWVGSSPALDTKERVLFVGLEFGLLRKRGGIAALDMKTGKTLWSDHTVSYTHATPLHIQKHTEVAIGSNDGVMRMYDARSGKKKWEVATGNPSEAELSSGFSAYDIKDAPAYSEKLDNLFVGTMQGTLCCISRSDGSLLWKQHTGFGIWSQPCVLDTPERTYVYASSLDKHVYCFDGKTGEKLWQWDAGARVFCAPTLAYVHDTQCILVGSNSGRLTALDPHTGNEFWHITHTERIVNAPVMNTKTKTLFVPTAANEVYCYALN